MEKAVENVEKCEFSTAIVKNSNSAHPKKWSTAKCIRNRIQRKYEIMSPDMGLRYLQKIEEKVGKMPKHPRKNDHGSALAQKYL